MKKKQLKKVKHLLYTQTKTMLVQKQMKRYNNNLITSATMYDPQFAAEERRRVEAERLARNKKIEMERKLAEIKQKLS